MEICPWDDSTLEKNDPERGFRQISFQDPRLCASSVHPNNQTSANPITIRTFQVTTRLQINLRFLARERHNPAALFTLWNKSPQKPFIGSQHKTCVNLGQKSLQIGFVNQNTANFQTGQNEIPLDLCTILPPI